MAHAQPSEADSPTQIASSQSDAWLLEHIEAECAKVARRVMGAMERMTEPLTLDGDEGRLTSVWEEYCAQVQDVQSPSFDIYEDIVRDCISADLDSLCREELASLWFASESGSCWLYEEDSRRSRDEVGRSLRLDAPVALDEVVEAVFASVSRLAADYESDTLYAYVHDLCVGEFDDDGFDDEEDEEDDTEESDEDEEDPQLGEGEPAQAAGHDGSSGNQPVDQTEVTASSHAGDRASWDALLDELFAEAYRTPVPPPISRDDQLPLDLNPETKP